MSDSEWYKAYSEDLTNGIIEFCMELCMDTNAYDTDDFDPVQMLKEFAAKYKDGIRSAVAAIDKADQEEEERKDAAIALEIHSYAEADTGEDETE